MVLLAIEREVGGIPNRLRSVDLSLLPMGINHSSAPIPKVDRNSQSLGHEAGVIALVAVNPIKHRSEGAHLGIPRSSSKNLAGRRCQRWRIETAAHEDPNLFRAQPIIYCLFKQLLEAIHIVVGLTEVNRFVHGESPVAAQ